MRPNGIPSQDIPQIIPITDKRTIDLTGQKFGRILVLGYVGRSNSKAVWSCRCDCGNTATPTVGALEKGRTVSCGCYSLEAFTQRVTKHNMSRSRLYHKWTNIISRCEYTKNQHYVHYGGRGITVCDRWRNFENFLADMGPRPGPEYSIERIDNDLGYSPENCKWATRSQQNENTRRNHILEYEGEQLTISQWAKRQELTVAALNGRLRLGWNIKDALTTPVKEYKHRQEIPPAIPMKQTDPNEFRLPSLESNVEKSDEY